MFWQQIIIDLPTFELFLTRLSRLKSKSQARQTCKERLDLGLVVGLQFARNFLFSFELFFIMMNEISSQPCQQLPLGAGQWSEPCLCRKVKCVYVSEVQLYFCYNVAHFSGAGTPLRRLNFGESLCSGAFGLEVLKYIP